MSNHIWATQGGDKDFSFGEQEDASPDKRRVMRAWGVPDNG